MYINKIAQIAQQSSTTNMDFTF